MSRLLPVCPGHARSRAGHPPGIAARQRPPFRAAEPGPWRRPFHV